MLKTCKWCGVTFDARTKRAEFCSSRCRVAHNRAIKSGIRVKMPDEPPSKVATRITEKEIASGVAQLRGLSSLFSAAADRGPENRRFLCRYISDSIISALSEVGL